MPLTPEEEEDYRALMAKAQGPSVQPKFTPEAPQETRGFLPRLGQGFSNIPADVAAMPTQSLRTLAGFLGWKPTENVTPVEQFREQGAGYQAMDAPQGAAEVTADAIPVVAREVGLLAAPQINAARILRAAGAGSRLAAAGSGIFTGSLSGLRNSGKEAGLQAAEFAAGNVITDAIPGATIPKILLKAGLQAAVPMAGQMARGESPVSTAGLTQAGAQGGIELLTGLLTRGRVKPQVDLPVQAADVPPQVVDVSVSSSPKIDEADQILSDLFPDWKQADPDIGPIRFGDKERPLLLKDREAQPPVHVEAPIPQPLIKLAKSPTISESNLSAELKEYSPSELSGLKLKYGTDNPKKLAGLLIKEHRQAERPRIYDADEPSAKGRTDAIDAMEERMPLKQLLSQAEQGSAINPLVSRIGTTALGGLIGYSQGDTPEERQRNAMLGALGGAVGPSVLKGGVGALKRLGPTLEAAARKETGTEGSLLGKAVLAAEKGLNLGRKAETLTAVEKSKGTLSQLSHQVTDTLRTNKTAWKEGLQSPVSRAAGEAFLASDGGVAAISALDSSGSSKGFRDSLKAIKLSQIEAQNVLQGSARSGSAREALLKQTKGTWQARVYDIFANPGRWAKDPAAFQQVVDELHTVDPTTSKETLAQQLDQQLASMLKGEDKFLAPSKRGVKGTLFANRADLTPQQWEFLGAMSADPRMARASTLLNDLYAKKADGLESSDQMLAKALSAAPGLSDAERQAFTDIASKEILTPAYRKLLGEIKDPFERQIYSLQKLFASTAQAKTIGELANTTLDSGAKMAYEMGPIGGKTSRQVYDEALQNATASGNAKLFNELKGYVQLDDSPSWGRLSGAFVPRDVKNALTEITQSQSIWPKWAQTINSWSKEVATAWNPGTQIRQLAQAPLFMMAARVNPLKIKQSIDALFGDSTGMMKELREQHMTEANFSHTELKKWSKAIETGTEGNILKRGWNKGRGFILGAYGVPDDLVRVSAYLSHKPRYLKEGTEKGLTGASLETYARDKTTSWVNDHTMNYGQVSNVVKGLRSVPFVSPFISFNAEMLRITKNLLKDVATGSPADKLWASAALGTFYAAPLALTEWAKNRFLTPKEQESWDKSQALMPTNERGKLKLPYGINKQGSFKYIDMGPWSPGGDFIAMIGNAAKGDWNGALANSPFGPNKNPVVSAVIDTTITGEHNFTHQKLDEPSEKVGRFAETMMPSLIPPGFLGKRIIRSLEPNPEVPGGRGEIDPRTGNEFTPSTLAPALLGVGMRTANPAILQRNSTIELKSQIQDAKKELNRVLRSGASPEKKAKAKQLFNLKRQEILEQ